MNKNRALLLLFIAVGFCLVIYSTINIAASYHANQGYKYNEQLDTPKAIASYEKALKLDRKNAEYHGALAELYNRAAKTSSIEADAVRWREKAKTAGENAIKYNPDFPYYNYIMAQIYFDSAMPVKADEFAERLVALQPLKKENYELLARGRVEAGIQYIRDKNISKARELIVKASKINEYDSPITLFYKGKALLLMGEYNDAERLLNKARGGSVSLKMESDRLLYIINQETNREDENKKYKYVIWMGMVEKTPDYKEIKSIISEKILQ